MASAQTWKLVYDVEHESIESTETTFVMQSADPPAVASGDPGDPGKGDTAPGAAKPGMPEPVVIQEEMVVLLSPRFVAIRRGSAETVYDFEQNGIFVIDRDQGTLERFSLYSEIGFREYELKNREFLANALRQSGVDKAVFDRTRTETLFSIEAETPANPVLDTRTAEGVDIYSLDGEESVRFRAAEKVLPEGLEKALVRLLVYGAQLHPHILDGLAAEPQIPAMLQFRYSEMTGSHRIRWELESAQPVELDFVEYLAVGEATAEPNAASDLALGLARRVLAAESTSSSAWATLDERTTSALEAGRFLDAMLVQLEVVLATGQPDADQLSKIRQLGAEDADLADLLQALGSSDPKEALAAFRSVKERADPTSAHVVTVFEANAVAATGEPDKAMELFSSALKVNPMLAGVYKDLGDLYYQRFETSSAWLLWDAARKISPEHPLLEDVQSLEERLRTSYPRFF